MSESTKIISIDGGPLADGEEPSSDLIEGLEKVLKMAKSGQLRSFTGTGFRSDGSRVSMRAGFCLMDVWAMKGAIYALLSEYEDYVNEMNNTIL